MQLPAPSRGTPSAAGVTLIEIVIAIGVVSIIALGLLAAYATAVNLNGTTAQTEAATSLVRDKLEEIRSVTPGAAVGAFDGQTIDLPWPPFDNGQLEVDFLTEAEAGVFAGGEVDLDGDGTPDETEEPHSGMTTVAVRITASWEDMLGDRSISQTSILYSEEVAP